MIDWHEVEGYWPGWLSCAGLVPELYGYDTDHSGNILCMRCLDMEVRFEGGCISEGAICTLGGGDQ